jgi:hypothetical protein
MIRLPHLSPKTSTLALLFFLLPTLHAADAVPAAAEKPVMLAPLVVSAQSLREMNFHLTINRKPRIKGVKLRGIEEPIFSQVDSKSIAALAGIQVGDRLVQIGELKLDGVSIEQFEEKFKQRTEGKLLLVIRTRDFGVLRPVELNFRPPPPKTGLPQPKPKTATPDEPASTGKQ